MPDLLDWIVQLLVSYYLPAPRPDSLFELLSAPEYVTGTAIRLAVTLLPPLFAAAWLVRFFLGPGRAKEGIPRKDDSPIPRRTDD